MIAIFRRTGEYHNVHCLRKKGFRSKENMLHQELQLPVLLIALIVPSVSAPAKVKHVVIYHNNQKSPNFAFITKLG
jgi:hypothetical protein